MDTHVDLPTFHNSTDYSLKNNKQNDFSQQIGGALADLFVSAGITQVLGIPGGAIAPLFGALSSNKALQIYVTQHEAGAAYAALGIGMACHRRELPVVFATSGPGITNLMTGAAAAYEEQVPLFFLTGNVATTSFNRGAAQDAFTSGIDATRMMESVTARSVTAWKAEDVLPLAAELIAIARKTNRPVHLNVPINLTTQIVPTDTSLSSSALEVPSMVDESSSSRIIEEACAALLQCERPVIFAGNGIKLSGLEGALLKAAEASQIPIVETCHGKGIVPTNHSLFRGTFGFGMNPRAKRFLEAYLPDGILFIGTRMGETVTAGWSKLFDLPAIRVHVDMDKKQLGKVYAVTHPVHADASMFLDALETAARETTATRSPPLALSDEPPPTFTSGTESAIHPGQIVACLNEALPENTTVVSDIGNAMAWAIHGLELPAGGRFFVPVGIGAMGSGIGAAIGMATRNPSVPIVCLSGDAAMLMGGNELFTAREHGLPVTTIVFNDGGHGMVDHGFRILGLHGQGLRFQRQVDFSAWASALGIDAIRITTLSELLSFPWEKALMNLKPQVIDISIDRAVVPPILARTGTISRQGGLPT